MNRKANAAVLLTGVLWGIISIFVKALSEAGLTLMQTVFVRSFFSALVLGVVLLIRNRSAFRVRLRDLWMFVGTGIISLVIFNRCYMYTMTHGNAAVGAVLLHTSPVFILLFSAALFHEKITVRKVTAIVLTFGGCVLVSGILSGGAAVPLPVLLYGIGAGFFYSLYTVFSKLALRRYDSAAVTFYTFLFAAFGSLCFAQPASLLRSIRTAPTVLLWAIAIAVVCTVIPYYLYTWGLPHMESGKAAVLVAVEPIVGTLLGILLYREGCSVPKLIGVFCVLAAILLLNIQKTSERKSV